MDAAADVAGDRGADVELAVARCGYGAAVAVGGVGASPNHRHLADPAPALRGGAARRGPGGEAALAVQRHGADGAEFALVQRRSGEIVLRLRARGAGGAFGDGQVLLAQG